MLNNGLAVTGEGKPDASRATAKADAYILLVQR
jgi:hypothetical protein